MKRILHILVLLLGIITGAHAQNMNATPLTFEAVEAGTIVVENPNGLTIQYNKNNTGWTSSSADPISITVAANDVVEFRGNNSCYWASSDSGETPTRFTATNPCYVYGNVMSLVHASDYATNNTLTEESALAYLFTTPTNDLFKFYENNSTILSHDTKELLLPANSVPGSGYMYMFAGCQGLTQAPELPATTIGMGSYHQMFAECTGLTAAPALLATTLSEMCYSNMFDGCTSLITAPDLPATTLATGCYMGMFTNCTSLVNAPALPATTLAEDCYHRMFEGCTSLTKAPDLPAATLFGQVYGGMFDGCSSLNYVKCLATNLGENVGVYASVAEWLKDVSPTGTFVKHPDMTAWPIGTIDGIPEGWTVKDDMYSMPLTFESLSNSLMINFYTKMSLSGLQYRKYNASEGTWSNWETFSSGQTYNTCSVSGVGSKIQFKRENNAPLAINSNSYSYFNNLSGNCYVYGNVMSLYNFETVLNDNYACYGLFDGNTGIRNHPTKDLVLGATTLSNCCYMRMFRNCTGLTRIPELPATTLAKNCYYEMFKGCTALNTTPELPATTLAESCYYGMFRECTSLTTPPVLPATTLAVGCYWSMFYGCTNLQTASALPATIMMESCYSGMFGGCTSLQTAPELPATTLATQCYHGMFEGCTGLTVAPALPATVMVDKCYKDMFSNCTNLQTAPALPSTSMAYWCYYKMFEGCTSLTTAPVLPATTLAEGCYIWMFWGCTNLNYVKCLATDISASNCTLNWLNSVSPTGTFIKADGMEDWEIGMNPDEEYYGIPEGWTVENIDVFTTDGNWNEATNWSGNAVPAAGSDVAIVANATIPSGTTINIDEIDVYGTLTIADGGQLLHNNTGVQATVQKSITGHNGNNKGGWYFIASPTVESLAPTNVTNMTTGSYDLYYFDEPSSKWRNYKPVTGNTDPGFDIEPQKGYLYANENTTTLSMTGTLPPSNTAVTISGLSHAASSHTGWNLVGNPFACNATVSRPCFTIQMEDGRQVIKAAVNNLTIGPCESVMVKASEGDDAVTFTRVIPDTQANQPNNSSLQITLAQANQTRGASTGSTTFIDNAIVSFNEGEQLEKFYFGESIANICLPRDNEEYAIAFSDKQGEMPLNFKAKENGTYTISVNPESVEMGYLHLIDNVTGADVDLLQTPSYTFKGKTNDYASRFRLVFATEDDGPSTGSGTFAFIDADGNIIINAGPSTGPSTSSGYHLGTSILQIFDALGRQVFAEELSTVNCQLSTVNYLPGVYVLRLINGDSVRTQKIVVK